MGRRLAQRGGEEGERMIWPRGIVRGLLGNDISISRQVMKGLGQRTSRRHPDHLYFPNEYGEWLTMINHDTGHKYMAGFVEANKRNFDANLPRIIICLEQGLSAKIRRETGPRHYRPGSFLCDLTADFQERGLLS